MKHIKVSDLMRRSKRAWDLQLEPKLRRLPVSDIGLVECAPKMYSSPKRGGGVSVGPSFTVTRRSDFAKVFIAKCAEASKICDFSDSQGNKADIRAKTSILQELNAVVVGNETLLTDQCWQAFFDMVKANLGYRRMLGEKFQEGIDMSWPHIKLVYEILATSVGMISVNEEMIWGLLHILVLNSTSFDERERQTAVQVLHSIYQSRVSLRYHVRCEMYSLMIEGQCSDELLELLGALVPGFSEPLKEEHMRFFYDAVLHLLNCEQILEALPSVIVKYIEKNNILYADVLSYMLMHFPITWPKKQVFFINVLRYLFLTFSSITGPDMLQSVLQVLGTVIQGDHSEAALVATAFIQDATIMQILQIYPECAQVLLAPVETAARNHWAGSIRKTCGSLLKVLHEITADLPLSAHTSTKKTAESNWKRVLVMARKRDRKITYK